MICINNFEYLLMNLLQSLDINTFANHFLELERIGSATFCITGATGLIGSTIVRCLLSLDADISISCPVRNVDKAIDMYGDDSEKISFVEYDLLQYLATMDGDFDYIIHCASPTAGQYMTGHPVETYELAIESTRLILNYAKSHRVKGVVYVSSLEYYGQVFDDRLITEDMQGYIDMMSPRSSYPLGKRAAEYLCTAYAQEYGVPVKIARLTQTFGAGVSADDNRVFAQFARSVIKGEDIVLHTTGDSAKPYCYTTDCASAILYILLKGKDGEAYNVANPDTYISIKDMAEFLRDNFNPDIDVRVELHPEMGYAPVTMLRLSADKLMGLGWKPQYDLKAMFERLIESMKS